MCEIYETWSMKLDLGCNWWWAYRLRANWVSPYIFPPTIFTTVNFDMSIHCWLLSSSSYFTFVTQLYFLNNLTLSSLVALSLGNQEKKRVTEAPNDDGFCYSFISYPFQLMRTLLQNNTSLFIFLKHRRAL